MTRNHPLQIRDIAQEVVRWGRLGKHNLGSDPQGPTPPGVPQASLPNHFGVFVPRQRMHRQAPRVTASPRRTDAPAPVHSPGYPKPWLPWVAQSVLGPARLVSTTPHTQPGGGPPEYALHSMQQHRRHSYCLALGSLPLQFSAQKEDPNF